MGKYFKDKEWELRGKLRPRILYLCEGESEAEYVDTWLTRGNADPVEIRVLCFRGLSKIDAKIKFLIKEPNFQNVESICIFLDAEQDFSQRIRDVEKLLRIMGFPHSESHSVPWVKLGNGKKSCVFISPDMKSSGRIENIVINELRGKKEIFTCLENFAKCSTSAGKEKFDEKQFVHSYIIMNRTGLSLGASFQKGLFDLNDPAYADLNSLLESAIT